MIADISAMYSRHRCGYVHAMSEQYCAASVRLPLNLAKIAKTVGCILCLPYGSVNRFKISHKSHVGVKFCRFLVCPLRGNRGCIGLYMFHMSSFDLKPKKIGCLGLSIAPT